MPRPSKRKSASFLGDEELFSGDPEVRGAWAPPVSNRAQKQMVAKLRKKSRDRPEPRPEEDQGPSSRHSRSRPDTQHADAIEEQEEEEEDADEGEDADPGDEDVYLDDAMLASVAAGGTAEATEPATPSDREGDAEGDDCELPVGLGHFAQDASHATISGLRSYIQRALDGLHFVKDRTNRRLIALARFMNEEAGKCKKDTTAVWCRLCDLILWLGGSADSALPANTKPPQLSQEQIDFYKANIFRGEDAAALMEMMWRESTAAHNDKLAFDKNQLAKLVLSLDRAQAHQCAVLAASLAPHVFLELLTKPQLEVVGMAMLERSANNIRPRDNALRATMLSHAWTKDVIVPALRRWYSALQRPVPKR